MKTPYLTTSRIAALRRAMPDLLASIRPTHHLTFTMRPNAPRWALEGSIAAWVNRVNRRYLGRNWYLDRNRNRRMKGVVFFERGRAGGNHHAHVIIRVPEGAELLNFEAVAPSLFSGVADGQMPRPPRPLVVGGTLHVQRIGSGGADLGRVVRYDTKEMEFRPSAYEDWNYIDDLSRNGQA